MRPLSFFLILLFLFCVERIVGQNLIPDSSFSQTNSFVNKYWNNDITQSGRFINSKDTFNISGTTYRMDSIMNYVIQYDTSHGDFFDFRPLNFRSPYSTQFFSDVVFCELSSPLVRDSVYEIKMWILPPASLSIPPIQVYFSQTKLTNVKQIMTAARVDLFRSDSSMIINNITSLRKRNNNEIGTYYSNWVIQFADQWLCISGTYKATGGEQFFYIGNVNKFDYVAYSSKINKRKLELVPLKDNNPHHSPAPFGFEFYIDDVSVRKKTISR